MKQVLQSLKSGLTEVADVPTPKVVRGSVLIETSRTLISAGTERMLVEFGKASLLEKARKQPERVGMVLDKIRTDGLVPTLQAVANKLDQALPLGYCQVGTVADVGTGVHGLSVGDRVASNGKHAEVVCVPRNLCAKVPDAVTDDEASFTVLAAIALQGIRLAQPTLGEGVVVTGLGLIGLLTVQLLRAHGCRVLGLDLDENRLALARKFGAETADLASGADPVAAALAFSRGRGVDAVLITASTSSSAPIHEAALMSRQRGRIILVGVTGLELSRDDFYKKELSFQVSSSYGPGRYDANYEELGQDYPFGFVRWTEQRNFEAVLDMMADGRLDVRPLISHRFAIDDAAAAYDLVTGSEPSLGILLEYAKYTPTKWTRTLPLEHGRSAAVVGAPRVSFIGSGNYAAAILAPAFKAAGASLRLVASSAGVSGRHVGRKFGFEMSTTDIQEVLNDAETDAVVVATRHDSHARLVKQALAAGKDVFVEKPLCLTFAELMEIEALYAQLGANGQAPRLMVGFNRRFAPHVMKMAHLLGGVSVPKAFVVTVNAGALPTDHWALDSEIGGGRILGEGCHFVDLLRHLCRAPITRVERAAMRAATADTASLQLSFADGSIGTIHYFANGNKSYPKERVEVFASGRVLQLDNFRRLTGFGFTGFKRLNLWRQDKGQAACAAAFVQSMREGTESPIPFAEIIEVSRVSIKAAGV